MPLNDTSAILVLTPVSCLIPLIPPDFIDDLLARTDIVEIIEARVSLKRTGQNYSGLCPFHTEKTPSFSVSAEKQFYYCFGCQATGSAIKFVMEFDRLDFIPAVELLAARAGLVVPQDRNQESSEKQQKRKSIYNVLEQSSVFYRDQLRQHTSRNIAVDYLKSRGLTGEIARDFGLGFAPPGWDNLYSLLAKTNHERQLLIDAGMVIKKDQVENDGNIDDEKIYDRFRDRIMFPIRDLRGRVIAFGGRIVGDGKPKYLNSPETSVFHKSRELYGLYEARKRNRKLDNLLVVEGYMDVVALAQHEVNNSVATLGTATTSEHLDRIFRAVPTVTFCFDGDTAGKNAAWKALLVSLAHMKDGRSARFLFVPDGEDPDSLIRAEGKDQFDWRLDRALHLPDFFFEKLQADVGNGSLDGKAQLSNVAMPLIMKIPGGVFRELMIVKLSEITNLSPEKLMELAGISDDFHAGLSPDPRSAEIPPPPPEGWDGYSPDEYEDHYEDYSDDIGQESSELANRAISLLLRQPELVDQHAEEEYGKFESAVGCRLLFEIIRTIYAEEVRSPVLLLAKYQDRAEFSHLKQLAEQEQLLDVADLPDEYRGVIFRLERKLQKESQTMLKRRLLAKSFADLTDDEKQQLRDITSGKSS